MADNPNVELAQEIMIERFGLEETTYRLESFSENSKGDISIKMSDGYIPVTARFPSSLLEFEKVRKMSVQEKREKLQFYLPHWNNLPMDVRMLFDDVAENCDDPDDLPVLRETEAPAEDNKDAGKRLLVKNKLKPKSSKKGA